MKVPIFPGRNCAIKRYASYFPAFELVRGNKDDDMSGQVVMCHSAGIEEALKSNAAYIVALDPSRVPDDPRVHAWIRSGREYDASTSAVVVEYFEQTHYPYQNKALRDAIVRKVRESNGIWKIKT